MANQLTKNFTFEELACKHCGKMPVPSASVERLQRLRDRFGKPMKVSSGYRCPEYNAQVSTTGPTGPHTKAAFDITVSRQDAYTLIYLAVLEGFTGIGVSQKGPHDKRFIHVDDLVDEADQPRPTIWSY